MKLPLVTFAAFMIAAQSAQAFDMAQGTSEVQISADDGLEWVSEDNRVIAHGNAKAVRGDVTVTADTLTAYYRKGGNSQIWRVDAEGHVTIANPTDTATGNKAIYDLDKAVLILTGAPAKLVTPTQTFTADEAIEYWEQQKMAVLRTNGIAETKDRKIQADVLTAHFKDSEKTGAGKKEKGQKSKEDMELSRADAFGHVILTTINDKATGDRGDYNAESGIATLTGVVTLTRDGNVMNGGFAKVDMNSGISTLYGNQAGDGPDKKKRVQAVFTPSQHSKDKTDAKDKPPQ
jgi:lipopolysaccharide export system protein LptA